MPLVLAGRVRPTMNLMRAELGAVTVLSADDLRFRSWETDAATITELDDRRLAEMGRTPGAGLERLRRRLRSRPRHQRRGGVRRPLRTGEPG